MVSLLLSNGHPDAPFYPVHRLWEESSMLTEQLNLTLSTSAILTQMAVSSLFSKEAGSDFSAMITKMTNQ